MEKHIGRIKLRADKLFLGYGFKPTIVNSEDVFERNGEYRKFTFVASLNSFVIEYAEFLEEAEKNLYEDSDLYPLSLGEDQLIRILDEDLRKYHID